MLTGVFLNSDLVHKNRLKSCSRFISKIYFKCAFEIDIRIIAAQKHIPKTGMF